MNREQAEAKARGLLPATREFDGSHFVTGIADALLEAYRKGLEAGAQIADAKCAEWWRDYKKGHGPHRASQHREGMSDGADEIASAIRRLMDAEQAPLPAEKSGDGVRECDCPCVQCAHEEHNSCAWGCEERAFVAAHTEQPELPPRTIAGKLTADDPLDTVAAMQRVQQEGRDA